MTGYQQGIMMALGSQLGNRFAVRSIDRFYPDSVAELFNGNKVFSVLQEGRDKPQFCVKSPNVSPPLLDDVRDWQGFCRAWIEIHGCLVPITNHCYGRRTIHRPGLKIFGSDEILSSIQAHLPITQKKIQYLSHGVDGGLYTGHTCEIVIRSRELPAVLDYIDGEPKNAEVWASWDDKIESISVMDE